MLRSTFLCHACILSFFPVHRLSGVYAGVISQFVIMLDENLQHFHFHTSSISGNVEGISVHKQIRVVMLTLQCCRCHLDWKCLWRLRRLAPSPLGSLELIQAYPCFSHSFKTGIPIKPVVLLFGVRMVQTSWKHKNTDRRSCRQRDRNGRISILSVRKVCGEP